MNAKAKTDGVKATAAGPPPPLKPFSRRSTTESLKSEADVEDSSSAGSSPASTPRASNKFPFRPNPASVESPKNEVVGEFCLVCNDRCFVRPTGEKLTSRETKLSTELRQTFYEIYQIPVDSDFIKQKSARAEFPLCYSCSYRLGQLKDLYEKLRDLHREFIKFQEVLAFSIVDIVAGAVPQRPLLDFTKLSDMTTLRFMTRDERITLQNMIYNDWHNKVPTFPDYVNPNIPKFDPIVDAPQVSQGHPEAAKMKLALPPAFAGMLNPTIFTRPVFQPSPLASARKEIAPTKRFKLDNQTLQDLEENEGENDEEADPEVIEIDGEGNEGEANGEGEYEYYEQDQEQDLEENGEGEEDGDGMNMLGEDAAEIEHDLQLQHFVKQGHFLESNGDEGGEDEQWVEGDEEEYNEYEQLYEDAGFVNEGEGEEEDGQGRGIKRQRRDSMAESIGEMNSNNIEYQQNEDGLFVCMFCSKTFIHKYPYRDHLKTHTGEGPRCPVCNKIFPKNHNLMLHMRTHTGEKPFTCTVCQKGFADKSNLKVHMRVHTGERPYKCEFCSLAFVNSSRLVVHRRMHTGEKPFLCNVCSKTFSTSNQLASHKKVHGNFDGTEESQSRPYGCTLCGISFSTEDNLQIHTLNYHPEALMD